MLTRTLIGRPGSCRTAWTCSTETCLSRTIRRGNLTQTHLAPPGVHPGLSHALSLPSSLSLYVSLSLSLSRCPSACLALFLFSLLDHLRMSLRAHAFSFFLPVSLLHHSAYESMHTSSRAPSLHFLHVALLLGPSLPLSLHPLSPSLSFASSFSHCHIFSLPHCPIVSPWFSRKVDEVLQPTSTIRQWVTAIPNVGRRVGCPGPLLATSLPIEYRKLFLVQWIATAALFYYFLVFLVQVHTTMFRPSMACMVDEIKSFFSLLHARARTQVPHCCQGKEIPRGEGAGKGGGGVRESGARENSWTVSATTALQRPPRCSTAPCTPARGLTSICPT